MRPTTICIAWTLGLLQLVPVLSANAVNLEEYFERPPADTRILKIIHNLPDSLEQQDQLFNHLSTQGFGGITTNVSFDSYMKDETKWESFTRGVGMAKERGMSLWLYDECGYPSGAAGGLTLQGHPEYEARGLHVYEYKGKGAPISLDLPEGNLYHLVGMPLTEGSVDYSSIVDIAPFMDQGHLNWPSPPENWRILAFIEGSLYENTHAEVSLAYKLPYINLLSRGATARFIEVTHEEYARRLGNDLGKYFVSTFTDEPSLMSLFMKPSDHRVLPWAPELESEFQNRRGYALKPFLVSLMLETNKECAKSRYDFWKTVGELVSENYFGQIQEWCGKHGVLSGGHLLCEESFLAAIPLYGNFFQCTRRLDAPSIDCLTSLPDDVPWHVARLLASAAELDNHSVTMCETSDHSQHYRPDGDTRPIRVVTEAEIRGTCNRLFLNGINTITSYYSFKDLTNEQLVRLNEWTGRCCTMIRNSRQVTDIALLYPVESAWVRFVPARHWVSESPLKAHRIEKIFHDAEENLFRSRRDFIHVDAATLAESTVEQGVLIHGNLRWRLLILPDTDTLPLAAWENIGRFYETGGAVVALTSKPENSESLFPDSRVHQICKEIFGVGEMPGVNTNAVGGVGVFLPQGSEALLPTILSQLIAEEVTIPDRSAPLRITHRRLEDRDTFFVINDSSTAWSGTLDLPTTGEVQQWDLATGNQTSLPSGKGLNITLDGYGALFFLCGPCPPPERKKIEAGGIPGLTLHALPDTVPVTAGGEFVNPSLTKVTEISEPAKKQWNVAGAITRNDVDTFLFACFNFSSPVNLREASCLSFNTLLPEGQAASVSMLVILRDASGVEYLAEAGIPMNAPGQHNCHVLLNRFRRAGWCAITDKPLDLEHITAIRIGWGGYHGSKNEKVTFSISSPCAG